MKKGIVFAAVLVIALFSVSFFGSVFAVEDVGEPDSSGLVIGKNFIEVDQPVAASDLVFLNPGIRSVSYYDDVNERTVGYVNVFGGIGEEFILFPGTSYEVAISEEIELVVPY